MLKKKQNKLKKICIDARFYGPVGKGLGRYTQEVVDGILALDKNNKYIIFLSRDNYEGFKVDSDRVKKILIKSRWYSLMEQIELPFKLLKEQVDLVHFPHFNVPIFCPVKFVVTIHDLILTKYPTIRASTLGPIKYWFKHLGYRMVISQAIKKAKKIIAVSLFTKNDIISNFKVASEKIILSYEGVVEFSKETKKVNFRNQINVDKDKVRNVLICYNIKKPYLLYVGNAYPHKNLERLVQVFLEVKKECNELSLVLVGRPDYFYKQLKEYVLKINKEKDSIIFPGFVPDSELKVLYQNALAYVFPSLYEGFGLPPLEAMSVGCPVLASNASSLPEILGSAAIYFNAKDIENFKSKLNIMIADQRLREQLIKSGFEQVKRYSWSKCVKVTFGVYEEILKRK